MCSLPERLRGVVLALTLAASAASQASLDLSFDRLQAPTLTLEQVSVSLQSLDRGPARLHVAHARIAGRELSDLRLDCAEFSIHPEVRCRGGVLRARGHAPWQLDFSLTGAQRTLKARVQPPGSPPIDIEGALAGAHPQLRLSARAVDLARLVALDPALQAAVAPYGPAGRVDVDAVLSDFGAGRRPQIDARVDLRSARFSSADGLRAAEGMALGIAVSARADGAGWSGRLSADWREGELLWDAVYLKGGGTAFESGFMLDGLRWGLNQGALNLAGVGRLDFSADWVRSGSGAPALSGARVEGRVFDLEALNARFIAPLSAVHGWPALTLSGRADIALSVDALGVQAARLQLHSVALADAAGRWSLDRVDADLPWQRDQPTAPHATVAGAHFGRIPLGPFELRAALSSDRVAMEPVRIPVLDAGLRLNQLEFARESGHWRGDLSFDLEPVSMPALSDALGLPRMAGSFAASVPGVRWRDGVLALDGQMLIRVFDGYIAATGLKLVEPFGATPRVLADLQMRYIDLEALTDTVKFGRVTGRLDGDVKGLELLRWRPVAFDAHIRSSDGDYPRVISQRAVQNITALGGPGAAAAIQRSFLGFFERFGYRRIGLSCLLRDGVCDMDGLSHKGGGFVLIEGGGVPALSVVGYNRRVDWPELLDRLSRVTGATPVVR